MHTRPGATDDLAGQLDRARGAPGCSSSPLRMRLRSSIVVMLLFRSAAHGVHILGRGTLPRVAQRLPVCMQAPAAAAAPATTAAGVYDHAAIELKWQRHWDEQRTFATRRRPGKDKRYVLDMFPYPSGAGLHVGHPEGYTASDIMARYWRMRDFDVLHPMGWDSFGLPAEQHAINTGTHPAVTTGENIANFKRQLKSLGFSYDWERELATTDEGYVKWTQWIFVQLFKRNLAVQSEVQVNWCPKLGTVLANEEVIDGLSERGSFPVERRPLRQWVLKITEYAERLAEELDGLQWPEGTMRMQRAWIGKSTGAELSFSLSLPADGAPPPAAPRRRPPRRPARSPWRPTAAPPPPPPPPARRPPAAQLRRARDRPAQAAPRRSTRRSRCSRRGPTR